MLLISISIIKRKPQNVNHKIRSDGIFCTIRPDANAPLAGAGRCRRGGGAGLVGAGRCLRSWGSFHGHGARLAGAGCCRRGFLGAGRGWWAQVVVCGHGAAFMGMGRCLRALGAVGAAFRERGGVGGRRSLFVRLSRRRVPIVNAGRCRCGFPGTGTSLADVESCWWTWGAVGGRRSLLAA